MNDFDKRELLNRLDIATLSAEELTVHLRTFQQYCDLLVSIIPDAQLESAAVLARDSSQAAITRSRELHKEIRQMFLSAKRILETPEVK